MLTTSFHHRLLSLADSMHMYVYCCHLYSHAWKPQGECELHAENFGKSARLALKSWVLASHMFCSIWVPNWAGLFEQTQWLPQDRRTTELSTGRRKVVKGKDAYFSEVLFKRWNLWDSRQPGNTLSEKLPALDSFNHKSSWNKKSF